MSIMKIGWAVEIQMLLSVLCSDSPLTSHGLDQIVSEPTRADQILDLVLTDLQSTSITLANVGTSDHNPVLVKLDPPPTFQRQALQTKSVEV